MSQKKVDEYKQAKANRAQTIKKEKMILKLEKAAAIVICIAAVGWIGFSVKDKAEQAEQSVQKETVMDTSALDEYLNTLAE